MNGAIVIEGHVQGLSNTRSLGELGIPVYVLDVVYCLAQHSKYCTKYFRCPSFKSKEFIDFLVDLAKKENIKGWFLICSNDHIVENLSLHAKELEQYYTFLVPNKENLYKIINKNELLKLAKTVGTYIPDTCDYNSLELSKTFRLPLLVKGSLGLSFYKATHQKAIQVNSLEELDCVLRNLESNTQVDKNDVMIQEMIPFDSINRVVSFTCFSINGEIKSYWMGKKLREHPIKYGTATCSESLNIREVYENAVPLVKELSYTGTCEIEFMYDQRDNVWKLIEINPRTWLWVGLAKACGVDYAKIMYKYAQGIQQEYPQSYIVGIKWKNYITDFVYGLKSILTKHIKLSDYIKSLKGKVVPAIWSWNDILPGIMFPLMLIYIFKKRG